MSQHSPKTTSSTQAARTGRTGGTSPGAATIGVLIPEPLRGTLFPVAQQKALEHLGTVRWWPGEQPPTTEQAIELLAGCTIGIGSWRTPHIGSADLCQRCPDLQLWEHAAGTVKSMFTPDVQTKVEAGALTIASCKGAIADTVAEWVLGALICGLRQMPIDAANNRRGPHGKPPGLGVLSGATVGVIGASEVGRRVLKLIAPFAARRLVFDPFADAAALAAEGIEKIADLADMCGQCHAVTLHTPLLPATQHLVGARALARLPDGALFINSSRGECVDEAALIAELKTGRLHAWLDVTDPEPAALDSPLRTLPNVVLTSHIAGPACALLGQRAVADVSAFLAGGAPQCVIRPDMLAYIA